MVDLADIGLIMIFSYMCVASIFMPYAIYRAWRERKPKVTKSFWMYEDGWSYAVDFTKVTSVGQSIKSEEITLTYDNGTVSKLIDWNDKAKNGLITQFRQYLDGYK